MRLYTLVVSIVAHTALIVVFLVVPLVALDALPGIRGVPDFVLATPAELPAPPPPARRSPRNQTVVDASSNPAPTSAPDRIEPEIVQAGVDTRVPYDGPGVPGGIDGGVALPGATIPVPPPPAVTRPLRPGGIIRPPQKIKDVAPIYPPIARSAGIRGTVILEAVIGETGRVRDVRVLRSIALLDAAALDAVRQWQFTPTLLNGVPVPIVMTVTVTFELR